jgi:cob(I)alamin adenosyltransferase
MEHETGLAATRKRSANSMSKIYTKTGDDGETGLFGGPRVRKDHPRIEAYGTVDELNAVLGIVRTQMPPPKIDVLLATIQNQLFDLGAELASPEPAKFGIVGVGPQQIAALEGAIDRHDADLEPLRQFILPGGTPAAATLHLARTVCRRAERRLLTLAAVETDSPHTVVYLNRLSDLLFVLARWTNLQAGSPDIRWQKSE